MIPQQMKPQREQPRLIWNSTLVDTALPEGRMREHIYHQHGKEPSGRILAGDNLQAMALLLEEGYEGAIKLVYMDPPFLSDTRYYRKIRLKRGIYTRQTTYPDRLDLCSYLDMLKARLVLAKRLLRHDGLIFVHCDWRVNSYIRVLLDELFGYKNFLNEIVWHYGGRGAKHISSQFPRNHDTIYIYRKGPEGRLKKLYIERLIPLKDALSAGYRIAPDGRVFKTAPRGDYTDESIRRLADEGRLYVTKNGNLRIKYFVELRSGMVVDRVPLGDVWTDIPDCMHTPMDERTGYRTQKPLKLMERIIECSTSADELVLDPFGGSGTTAVAAHRLKRRWILCEQSPQGVALARKRLLYCGKTPFVVERLLNGATSHKSPTMPVIPAVTMAEDNSIEVSLKPNPSVPLPEGLCPDEAILLVDYWAVDWDYKGNSFNACWLSFRDERRQEIKAVATSTKGVIKSNKGAIAVKVADLFGNDHTYIIEPREYL